jgi:hypothetical protein
VDSVLDGFTRPGVACAVERGLVKRRSQGRKQTRTLNQAGTGWSNTLTASDDGDSGQDHDSGKMPIGEALPGAEIYPLDRDLTFDAAFMLIRTVDEDGITQWAYRATKPMNLEQLLGALVVQVEILKGKIVAEWDSPGGY